MDKETGMQRFITKKNLIGQILLSKKLITDKQLEEALAVQKKEGGLLGDILVRKEFISEELLCTALANQSDICYLPVEQYDINKEVLKIIPKDIAIKYYVIPLEKIGEVLTVAMADPFDQKAVSAIEIATGCKLVPVIGIKTQIGKIIKFNYQD